MRCTTFYKCLVFEKCHPPRVKTTTCSNYCEANGRLADARGLYIIYTLTVTSKSSVRSDTPLPHFYLYYLMLYVIVCTFWFCLVIMSTMTSNNWVNKISIKESNWLVSPPEAKVYQYLQHFHWKGIIAILINIKWAMFSLQEEHVYYI
jgi:hypothetical protein